MITIPQNIISEWENKQAAIVLTTISAAGVPNSIYATQTALFGANKVLVANNKFHKTLQNISENEKVTLLFITKQTKAYQLKGTVKHETEGAAFDDMKKWNRADLPGLGVAVITVDEIFSGAEKLM